MAVVVRSEGENYYKVHRLVLPDGSRFSFNKKGDIVERAGGAENSSGLSPTNNISNVSISNADENVNPVEAAVIKTVEDRIFAKIENSKEELSNNQRLLEESNADFDRRIAEAQAEYDAKKNKNTNVYATTGEIGTTQFIRAVRDISFEKNCMGSNTKF